MSIIIDKRKEDYTIHSASHFASICFADKITSQSAVQKYLHAFWVLTVSAIQSI